MRIMRGDNASARLARIFPNLNGPGAYDIGNDELISRATDYAIGRSVI
jgi:hypothetical protein